MVRFQELWKKLNITNDSFIRTTDPAHKQVVRDILQDLFDRGEIYKAEYTGHYCVPCERFFTDKDLAEGGLCPECGRPTGEIVESNYFFRMSKYQDWLIEHINANPEFIQPSFRANETLGFLRKPLGDLCISRPKSRLAWGIELPFDSDYVCYVWFDALINYISGVGYRRDQALFERWWPASCHLIGKDILTTHTVYWPTMLRAIGLEMPRSIFAHGWWLTGRDKMSKSLGNVVNPMDMCEKYGVDAFRYFLMAEMTLGQDASFTEDAFVNRYNTDLANDLGNLLSRVVKMTLRQNQGCIPVPEAPGADEEEILALMAEAAREVPAMVEGMKLDRAIDKVMQAVRSGNRYMEKTAPWSLAKKGETGKLNTVLYYGAELLRQAATLLHPVMPEKMTELLEALGLPHENAKSPDIAALDHSGQVLAGLTVKDINALFLRIERENTPAAVPAKKEQKAVAAPGKDKQESAAAPGVALIGIDDFFKTQLKTAIVMEAERVEGSDKLLKLQIELGGESRQLVAGIAQHYKPDELLGRTIVVVANLKPAKIRGIESQGMLLCAKNGDTLKLLSVDGKIPGGSSIG